MALDPGQPASEVGDNPFQPLPAQAPQGTRQAMDPDGVHARVAGQHFKGIARRRVTMENALDIFTQTIEHLYSFRLISSPRTAFWVSVRMPRNIFISARLTEQIGRAHV